MKIILPSVVVNIPIDEFYLLTGESPESTAAAKLLESPQFGRVKA